MGGSSSKPEEKVTREQGSPTQNSEVTNMSHWSEGFHISELHAPTLGRGFGFDDGGSHHSNTSGISQVQEEAIGGQAAQGGRQANVPTTEPVHARQATTFSTAPIYILAMEQQADTDPPAHAYYRPGASYVASRSPSELRAVCTKACHIPTGEQHTAEVLLYHRQPGRESAVYAATPAHRKDQLSYRVVRWTEAARTELNKDEYYEQFLLSRLSQKQLFRGLFTVSFDTIGREANIIEEEASKSYKERPPTSKFGSHRRITDLKKINLAIMCATK